MRVLIIGLGSIAKKHISALRIVCNKPVIYALRSSNDAFKYTDVINVYSLEEISVNFDFVLITNPSNLHKIYIDYFVSKDTPIFVEKPVVTDLHSIEFVSNLLLGRDLPTYVGCNLRFRSSLIYLRNMIYQNKSNVNEVNIYCGSYLPDWRKGTDYRKSYSADSRTGGGVHLDLFHELDYVVWLFGMPNDKSVILRKTSSLEINSPDYASYTFSYENYTINVILNYYRPIPKRNIEVVFSNDIITVDLINNRVNSAIEGDVFSDDIDFNQTYIEQMKHFIDVVKGRSASLNSIEESLEVLKLILD